MGYILDFVFYYPLTMSFVWMCGAFIFAIFREKKFLGKKPKLKEYPLVSVLIPCHNEEQCIEDTITYLQYQKYPNIEIIAVDDASRDKTYEILLRLQKNFSNLRVIQLTSNQGKGTALNMAAMASKGEYLICIDADALLDPDAIEYLMWHFESSPRVGAITGNPKVRNRTTLMAKIQVGEYSTIIGMIKRAQRILGKVYTVSGVVAAFRKKAVLDVGWWSNNMVTEDIDISWKLQLDHWDIRYEARALCWIYVPETIHGICKQRLRWAQGGNEVLIKYFTKIFDWRNRRMIPLYLEYATSVAWCYLFIGTIILWILGHFIELPEDLIVRNIMPGWSGIILALTCTIQLCIGVIIDSKYDPSMKKVIPYLIWYPAIYWIVTCLTTIVALPRALFKKRTELAVWESPDRGIK